MYRPGVGILLPGKACFLLRAVDRRLGLLGREVGQCLALDVVRVLELEPKPWSSMAHTEMRPVASGFSRGLLRLYLDTTVIGCYSKYGLILREAMRIASSSFCIMGYLSWTSRSTELTK